MPAFCLQEGDCRLRLEQFLKPVDASSDCYYSFSLTRCKHRFLASAWFVPLSPPQCVVGVTPKSPWYFSPLVVQSLFTVVTPGQHLSFLGSLTVHSCNTQANIFHICTLLGSLSVPICNTQANICRICQLLGSLSVHRCNTQTSIYGICPHLWFTHCSQL